MEVGVLTIAPAPVTLTQDLPGRISALRVAEVRARVNGIVLRRLFTEGSDVTEGQVLYEIDAAPYQGVLPLPISALRAASPVLSNPANYKKAIPLTYEQFRYAFANQVSEEEAHQLYSEYAVPAPGAPLFQAAVANFNPWSEVKVDHENPYRGPMLVISGEKDHTVPPAISEYQYKLQQKNSGVTEFASIPGRGHSLTIDSGWLEVANTALAFVQRFAER